MDTLEVTEIGGGAALEALNRSEINMQIETALRHPRDIDKCKKNIVALAAMDEDIAYNCFYHLERRDKDGKVSVIEGPSIRLAEIIIACWKNLRVAARIIANDGKTITAQGVCHDLESNVAISVENKRSILTSKGYTYSADMQVVVGNAAAAIALRNAVCKVVPQVLIKSCIKEIQTKALEHIKQTGVEAQWKQWLGFMQGTYHLSEKDILDFLGRKTGAEVIAEDIQKLGGAYNAIKEGTATVEDIFKQPKKQQSIAEATKQAANNASSKAAEAISKSTKK